MPSSGIPEDVRRFIFEHLDSAEMLEVLLLLRSFPEQTWNATSISSKLRTNEVSVANRLDALRGLDLLESTGEGHFRFAPKSESLRILMDQLAETFRIRRHKVYELIFSPLKKARSFADAFVVRAGKDGGENDG